MSHTSTIHIVTMVTVAMATESAIVHHSVSTSTISHPYSTLHINETKMYTAGLSTIKQLMCATKLSI